MVQRGQEWARRQSLQWSFSANGDELKERENQKRDGSPLLAEGQEFAFPLLEARQVQQGQRLWSQLPSSWQQQPLHTRTNEMSKSAERYPTVPSANFLARLLTL